MTRVFDPVEIAQVVAEIAGRTDDPGTARELMDFADQLLTAAGLPKPLPKRSPSDC
jgi:hypothetical protein